MQRPPEWVLDRYPAIAHLAAKIRQAHRSVQCQRLRMEGLVARCAA